MGLGGVRGADDSCFGVTIVRTESPGATRATDGSECDIGERTSRAKRDEWARRECRERSERHADESTTERTK
jgi:hypothetical protein